MLESNTFCNQILLAPLYINSAPKLPDIINKRSLDTWFQASQPDHAERRRELSKLAWIFVRLSRHRIDGLWPSRRTNEGRRWRHTKAEGLLQSQWSWRGIASMTSHTVLTQLFNNFCWDKSKVIVTVKATTSIRTTCPESRETKKYSKERTLFYLFALLRIQKQTCEFFQCRSVGL